MRAVTLSLAGLASLGCRGPLDAVRPGEIYVEWRGSQRGRFLGPATTTHCAETGLVEVIAAQGDTGVGLVLYPADSGRIAATSYPVVEGRTMIEPRPGVGLALRWFDVMAMHAFDGLSGSLEISAVTPAGITGVIDARLQSVDSPDTLVLRGHFREVPVRRAPPGCKGIHRRRLI